MQLTVTVTDKEKAAMAHFIATRPSLPGWLGKIAKAMAAPPKIRKTTKALWQMLARPDLKASLSQVSIGRWQMPESAAEPCAHCGQVIDGAVTIVSKYGQDFKPAHLACALDFWKANSPYSGIANPGGDFILRSYTEQETANTASAARALAKAS